MDRNVGAHVVVHALFPFEGGVGHLREVGARLSVVGGPGVVEIGGQHFVGVVVLVARQSGRGADLELFQNVLIAQEGFVVEVPRHAGAPCRRPAVVGAVERRGAFAEREVDVVAVVVAVRRGSQETDFARDRRDADGLFVLGVLPGEGDVGRLAVGESLGVVLVGAVRVFGDPAAGVDVEVVPAPVFGVVGVDFARNVAALAVVELVGAFAQLHARAFVGRGGEFRMLGRIEFVGVAALYGDAEAGGEFQRLGGLPFGVEVVRHAGVGLAVERSERGVVHRVGHFVVGPAGDLARLGIDGAPVGIHPGVVPEIAPRRVVAPGVADAQYVAEQEAFLAVRNVHVAREHRALRTLHHARHVVVREVDHRPQLAAVAQFDREGVFVADARAQGFCEPVGVQSAEHLRFECVVAFGEIHLRLGIRRGVDALDALGLELLPGVAEVVARQVGHRHLDASGVGHQLLIAGQAFGLDDDDAVGGLRAVERLGRGVLEDGDALDTGHVHVHHLLGRGFEPVEDEQRLVGAVLVVALDIDARGFRGEGGDTAQLHVRQRVGVGAHQRVVHDVERWLDVFQALEDVAVTHAGQLARRDGRGRTRVALLLAGEDAGHHDVFDLLFVLHQPD